MDILIIHIIIGLTLLSVSSSVLGTFVYAKNDSLSADAIAHATFPGLCIGFILSGTKDSYLLWFGALITGIICQWLISYITINKKISKDTATAIVLITLFAGGLVLLKFILDNPYYTNKSGLNNFFFGQVASIQRADVIFIALISFLILIGCLLYRRSLLVHAFEPNYFKMLGWSSKFQEHLYQILLTSAIIIGIQSVGVILVAAFVAIPSFFGRLWSNDIRKMMGIAVLASLFSVYLGTFLSIQFDNPTGPWIVLILSILVVCSILIQQLLKSKSE